MANGMEMMVKSLVKGLGIDPEQVQAQVHKAMTLMEHMNAQYVEINNRLTAIEAHLSERNSTANDVRQIELHLEENTNG